MTRRGLPRRALVSKAGAKRGKLEVSPYGGSLSGRTRKRRKLVIAIDGPAGSGKSSTAKALAKALHLPYIDTGAMYRAVTLKAMRNGVSFKDVKGLAEIAQRARIRFAGTDPDRQRVFLDGEDVTRDIRLPELTQKVFYTARERTVRREMVKKQRTMGKKFGAVVEGRDIGTVVFPDADYKFFFDASLKIRARRRRKDLAQVGRPQPLGTVLAEMNRRDASDVRRKEGPLKKAPDAFFIDTSSLTIRETVDMILSVIESNPLRGRKLSTSRAYR